MSRLYRAYGLTLRSGIELPELDAAEGGDADVEIVIDTVSGPMPPVIGDRICRISTDGAYFAWNGLGRIAISNWNQIKVAPEAGVSHIDLAFALLGPVMATLLHGRGDLILHGSAVDVGDGRAVLFVGDNGAGKSTFAAACVKAGLTLVNDDVAALPVAPDGIARIRQGFPAMKLSLASLAALDPMPGSLLPAASDKAAKLRIRLPSFAERPLRLSHIFKVVRAERLDMRPLAASDRLNLALRYSYMPKLGADALGPEAGARHFRQCATAAHATPASILTLPEGLDDLPALADPMLRYLDRVAAEELVTGDQK